MSLDKTKLKNNLIEWMNAPSNNIEDTAEAFANAYDGYALDAQDISGDSPLVLNKSAILAAFKTLTTIDTAQTAAIKIENGLVLYWTGGLFNLLIPPLGTIPPEISAIVTAPIIPPAISTGLGTIFLNIDKEYSTEDRASDMADLLDTATKLVIVTCIGTLVAPPFSLAVLGPIS
jgi:hypothetical protein